MAKISTLTDNFEDASLDTAKWTFSSSGGSVYTEENGVLKLQGRWGYGDYAMISSTNTYDIEDDGFYVRLVDYDLQSFCRIGVIDGGGDGYEFKILDRSPNGIDVEMYRMQAGSPTYLGNLVTEFYNETDYAWWRFREAAGTFYVDSASSSASNPPTSGDWTNRFSESTYGSMDLTAVNCYMQASHNSGSGICHFDGFNTGTVPSVNSLVADDGVQLFSHSVASIVGMWV